MEIIKKLLSEARLLPSSPGVYKMFDKNDKVIYVGKSKSLKNRVSQYFQNTTSHNAKTRKMVNNVVRFECVFTDTENEALVLENELIKLFAPKFNIRLKDDKSYPYIMINTSERFPRVKFVRSLNVERNKTDKFFGPYSSSSNVYNIIDTVNKIFKLPTCKRKFPEDIGKERPCLNYHIDRCSGVCNGNISEEKYRDIIKSVVMFLKSEYEEVLKELESKMYEASDNMKFEEAAEYRDLIVSIKNLRQHQKIVFADSVNRDVFGFYSDDISSCISISVVRNGRIVDNHRYSFTNDEILDEYTFADFLIDYYKHREDLPKEIFLPGELTSDETLTLSDYFLQSSGKHIKIVVPEKGDNKKAVTMASENAKEFTIHQRNVFEKNEEKLVELSELLHLEVIPELIEAYDISNSAGEHTVAGAITIKDGKFYKKGYKLFNIKEVSLDDYGSMKEAITRRLNRYFENNSEDNWTLPDLILVDGGSTHVKVVKAVIKSFNLDIPVFGMVKDSHHKTRTLTTEDEEISIAHNTKIFNFIYGIQEEVHRFTFSSMDKKRRKSVSRFSLEKCQGIGPKKAKILMQHFKSVKNIKNATVEEICSVKGISKKDAENIVEFYEKTQK